jgi:hypothetical protein
MQYAACWYSALTCATLIAGLSRVAPAQESPRVFYVVRTTGNWVVGDGTEPVRPLQRIEATARIGVQRGVAVKSNYEIVLRDPRTLQTHTWVCKPVARCSTTREAGRLSSAGPLMKTSQRTAALFVHLSGAEERSRARTVGARGSELDLGLLVLVADSARLDARPLRGGIDTAGAKLVARFCELAGERPRTDCATSPTDECALADWASCTLRSVAPPAAVAIAILTRDQPSRPDNLVARAVGVVTTLGGRARVAALAQLYTNDLAALRAQLTNQEFRALQAAAALAIANSRD